MHVENVMTRGVFFVTEGMEILMAAELLKERNISGAPVVSKEERLVGMVTLRDFSDPSCPEEGLVSEVMHRDPIRIESDASLREAAQLMVTESAHQLFVVDDEKIVGVVSTLDLLAGLLRETPDT